MPTDTSTSPSPKLRKRNLLFEGAWYLNLLAFLLTLGWLFYDGYLHRMAWAPVSLPGIEVEWRGPEATVDGLSKSLDTPRRWVAWGLQGACFLSWGGIVTGLLIGGNRYRGVRAWLGLMLSVVLWLVLWTNWGKIVEAGRFAQVSGETKSLLVFSQKTYDDWESFTAPDAPPRESWVPFNAYPLRKPSMLFFLGEQVIPETNLTVRSIERTAGEAIRFELSGSQLGNWVEWRVDDSPPKDFTGGLEAPMEMVRWRKLADRLYLVQYQ